MVRDQPDPPSPPQHSSGGLAQLGEHLLCKQGVVGSIPSSSTISLSVSKHLLSSALILALPIESRKTYGCSLTIHRVESALSTERASWLTVPLTTIFDCVTTNFSNAGYSSNLNRKIQLRHNAPGERPGQSLINFGFVRNVKIIGSSD